jgi:excinuclease UvrABC nuclease subunit
MLNSLEPKIEKTIEFDFSSLKKAPQKFGCYIISNFENKIMYIGKATSLKNRFINHLDTKEKNKNTKIGRAYWFSFKICNDEFEIAKIERGWLNQYELKKGKLPIFNKIRA